MVTSWNSLMDCNNLEKSLFGFLKIVRTLICNHDKTKFVIEEMRYLNLGAEIMAFKVITITAVLNFCYYLLRKYTHKKNLPS